MDTSSLIDNRTNEDMLNQIDLGVREPAPHVPLVTQVKRLRAETGASLVKCRQALLDAHRDYEKAVQHLKETGP